MVCPKHGLPSPCVACLAEPVVAYYDKENTILISDMVAKAGMKASKAVKAMKVKKTVAKPKKGAFARSHTDMNKAKKASTV